MPGGAGDGVALAAPGHHSIVTTGEVVVTLGATHCRARVGNCERTLPRCAAGQDLSRLLIPAGDGVRPEDRSCWSRIRHRVSATTWCGLAADRACTFIPAADTILLVLVA